MSHERNWVLRRSKVVNRLRKEELGDRLTLYERLEAILEATTISEEHADEEPRTRVLDKESSLPYEDSALGVSLCGETLNGTTVEREASDSEETPVPEITDTVDLNCKEERSEPVFHETYHEKGDFDLADEFHAALGPELDVVRQQIASILEEGPILFPLELISRLYLGYGRRLPQSYEGFSTKSLMAWLKGTSRLDLDNLIFEFLEFEFKTSGL